MSTSTPVIFSHSRHKLRVSGCKATLDVLSFEGEEALSQPFKYSIQFTSCDLDIAAEDILQHWADFSFLSVALSKAVSGLTLRSLYGTGRHSFGGSDYPGNDYRGRGMLHLTHCCNYSKPAKDIGKTIDTYPELVSGDISVMVGAGL
jgi:hypothetical protein